MLAVHNGEQYLETAIRSIMNQTLRNIEIIVVDDASSDSTPDILKKLQLEDSRITVVTSSENLRLAGSLNRGLSHVRAPYVARMDDDDIALPERLETQKRFLDTHEDVVLVAASINWINEKGHFLRRSVRPRDSFGIRWLARFSLTLPHPTFMFRRQLSDGSSPSYNVKWNLTEDHDFVCRLLRKNEKVVCLPDVLLNYRFHNKSVSRQKIKDQMQEAKHICEDFQKEELPEDIFLALKPVRELYFDLAPLSSERLEGAFAGMRAMLAHDLRGSPERAVWLRRQTAQHLVWCLQRCGASRALMVRAFAFHAFDMLLPLMLRKLETKRLLMGRLYTDPEIW